MECVGVPSLEEQGQWRGGEAQIHSGHTELEMALAPHTAAWCAGLLRKEAMRPSSCSQVHVLYIL